MSPRMVRLVGRALTAAVALVVVLFALDAPANAAPLTRTAATTAARPAANPAGNGAVAHRATGAAVAAYAYACGEPPFQGNDGPGNIFTAACQFHDDCYWGGTNGHRYYGNRLSCDVTFEALMWTACDNNAPNAGCYAQALLYYNIVRSVGWAYWAGNWWDNI